MCRACSSHNVAKFNAEICLHYRDSEVPRIPATFLFPTISVCLNCGIAEFNIDNEQLLEIKLRT
jgi:hypothetical protein